jgi:hypothetical protein
VLQQCQHCHVDSTPSHASTLALACMYATPAVVQDHKQTSCLPVNACRFELCCCRHAVQPGAAPHLGRVCVIAAVPGRQQAQGVFFLSSSCNCSCTEHSQQRVPRYVRLQGRWQLMYRHVPASLACLCQGCLVQPLPVLVTSSEHQLMRHLLCPAILQGGTDVGE